MQHADPDQRSTWSVVAIQALLQRGALGPRDLDQRGMACLLYTSDAADE